LRGGAAARGERRPRRAGSTPLPGRCAGRSTGPGHRDRDRRGRQPARPRAGPFAADAILLPPGEAPVAGRDKIRPRYEALFAGFSPEIEPRIDEACVAQSFGFVRGRNGGRLVPRSAGEPRALDDTFVMLLRLEPDGAWRISHLIWHRQSAPAAAPVGR
jgi:ketosteroid isomerase-like protein